MSLGSRIALAVVLHATVAEAEHAGVSAGIGGGLNVGTPFVQAQLGRRFRRASHFELFLDYSYDKAISEFSFQTFGVGARTYVARTGRFEVFHQAVAAFVVSSSGDGPVQRAIGERLLGPMFTQGLGAQLEVHRCWTVALVLSTGYPVWLRPELSLRYTF